jgi:hypothetical protein
VREPAVLRLSNGEEINVEVDPDDLEREQITVRRTEVEAGAKAGLAEVARAYLATAKRHPAGTTDRLLAADRERPY